MTCIEHSDVWLKGHTPMTQQVLGHDWSSTSLGPLSGWPESLRMPVQLLLQSRQPMYVAWGPDLISIYNEGYIPILGDKHPQGLGQPFRQLWAEVLDEFEPVIASIWKGQSHYYENRPVALARRPNRPMSWFTFSWTPLYDQSGQVQGFLSVASETTDRIIESAKLTKVMHLMDEMERITHTGSWELDLDSGHIVCSTGMLRLHGLDPAGPSPTPQQWRELLHPEETELKATPPEQLIAMAAHLLSEYRIVTPQGEMRWMSSSVMPATNEHGANTLIRGITVNLTQRKSMELGHQNLVQLVNENQSMTRILRAQQSQLHMTLDAANLGLWQFDAQTRTFVADRRLCQILGEDIEADKPNLRNWQQRMHPDDVQAAMRTLNDHLQGLTESYEVEYRIRHSSGHWIWMLLNGRVVVRDDQDHPLLVAGTAQDITRRKRQSQQGMDLLEQIKSLIQDMGHSSKHSPVEVKSEQLLGQLTKRQRQLLELIARGWTTARIAAELHISTGTAVSHRRGLMRKLNLHNTAEVTSFAIRCGLLCHD